MLLKIKASKKSPGSRDSEELFLRLVSSSGPTLAYPPSGWLPPCLPEKKTVKNPSQNKICKHWQPEVSWMQVELQRIVETWNSSRRPICDLKSDWINFWPWRGDLKLVKEKGKTNLQASPSCREFPAPSRSWRSRRSRSCRERAGGRCRAPPWCSPPPRCQSGRNRKCCKDKHFSLVVYHSP